MKRVPGFGPLTAKIVCIGETPGEQEVEQGRPFVGKSGEELTERWLRSAGIDPEGVRYENVGEFRPIDNDFNRLPGLHGTHPSEYLADSVLLETGALGWLSNLHNRLARLLDLRCIISVGIWPARLLLSLPGLQSTKHRGSVFDCQLPDGRTIPVIPTIHPSYLLRNQLWALRFFGLNDCVKARRIANGLDWKSTLPRIEAAKDFEDAERLLKFLLRWCGSHPDSPLAFDTETLGQQIDTISFGVEDPIWKDRIYGTSIGFETFEGPRFSFDQELYLWGLIQELLWLPNPKVGHNLQYDLRFLTDMGIGVNNVWWDTLYAAHALNPAVSQDKVGPIKPRGLDVLSSLYTYVPYYKDERVSFGDIPVEDRWLYAAKDGAVTLMVQRGQEIDLSRSPSLQNVFFNVSMPQLIPFHRMEVEGVPINKEVLSERKKVLEAEIGPLQERLTLLRYGQASIDDWQRSLGDARNSLLTLRESVERGSLLATCPSCNGQGGVVRCRGRKAPQLKYETCRKCKGVGEIADPHAKSRVREAERLVRRLEAEEPRVNARSSGQLIEWLFKPKSEGGLGLKGRKKRGAKTDNPSTGEDELRLLLLRLRPNQNRERDILDTILAIRERETELSNFVDLNLSPDGRFRTQNQPLEDTGRCHSRPDAYRHGRNFQNFPRKGAAKRSVEAPSGYCICKFDYKQIEAVLVAWDAMDADFIEAVQGGVRDVHTEAAIIAFGRRPEEFDPKEWKEKWRFAGKRVRHGCHDSTTEVLTPNGWVPFSKYQGEPVAQWWSTGAVGFARPIDVAEYPYKGKMYHFTGRALDQLITPDHNVWYETNGRFKIRHPEEVPRDGRIPVNGTLYAQLESSKLARVVAAIQADGYIHSSCGVVFHLHKKRKVEQLYSLGVEVYPYACGDKFRIGGPLVKTAIQLLGVDKNFGPWLLNWDEATRLTFLRELPLWDGSRVGSRQAYLTTNENNATWVQIVAHLTGVEALLRKQGPGAFSNKPMYEVSFNRRRFARAGEPRLVDFEGMVHCVTVPSGAFFVRRNGRVSVSGNSAYGMGATRMWEQILIDIPGFDLTIKDCQRALDKLAEASPLITARKLAIIEEVRRTRLIVAPDGGCLRFYSPWDEHIGKASLAYRPQRWAATMMNTGLVRFHHYWWERDKRVQLLAQVHDSAVWITPDELADETARVAIDIWGAPFRSYFPDEDRQKGPIVVPMELSIGPNLNDQKEVEAWNRVNWRERQLKG